MRTLSLDPSSTAIGWAMFDDETLDGCGVLKSSKSGLFSRIDSLLDQLNNLPMTGLDRVLIEVTSGRRFDAKRAQTSIVALGLAQGAVWANFRAEFEVYTATEQDWTGNRPKATRAARVLLTEPIYAAYVKSTGDPGLDAADAIGLAHWWFGQQRQAAALAQLKK